MKALYSTKLKPFIKRIFPFIIYRWHIYAALRTIKPFVYHRVLQIISEKDLTQDVSLGKNNKLEIEAINESNRESLKDFIKNNFDKNTYRYWLRYEHINNYNGFIGSINGNIIGYVFSWDKNNGIKPPLDIFLYNIKLKKNEVYMFNFLVADQYRGSGNAIEFTNKVSLYLKKLGYISSKGVCDEKNLPARWTYKIVGQKDIFSLTVYVFLNCIIYCNKSIFFKNPFWHPNLLL